MEFHRLQDKLTAGQFVQRRHYCITDKVFDYVEDEQLKLKKKDRKNCPTKADMYYQLIIEGLKYVDNADLRKLPDNHKVRIKIGKPINEQLYGLYGKSEWKPINIFSLAVCLMECAIDNQ